MAAIAVVAYGFASTFRIKELPAEWRDIAAVRVEKDQLTAEYPSGAVAQAFDFGALVFFDCPAEERARVVKAVTARLQPEPHPPIEEELLVEVRPGPVEVQFARVLVPVLDRGARDIVALALAQSVATDYYAEDVEQVVAKAGRIAGELQERGRIRGPVRELQRFIGLCMSTRNAVVTTLALFDKPEAVWESEQLDRLWAGLRHSLELEDRSRALEAKLRIIQENLEVFVDLSRQRQGMALEWIVVILILVEVVLAVVERLHQ